MIEEREKTDVDVAESQAETVVQSIVGNSKVSSMSTRKTQKKIFIVAMLFLPIVHWLVSWIYINGSSLLMAFQDDYGKFTLSNFPEVYDMIFNAERNNALRNALLNSMKSFFVSEFIGVPISLVISYFLYKKIWGYKTFRTIFYFPHIISSIVLVLAVKQLLSPLGPVNALFENSAHPLPTEGLLHTPATAMNTIIFYSIWTGACGNVLFYSAMSRVPPELIEAGKIDGLGLMKELLYVIMPLIWPTFSTTLILDLTNILNAGGPVLLFGVRDVILKANCYTLPYWFFSQVYDGGVSGLGSYGVMSCAGLCFTVISVPFTLIIRHLLNKVPTAEY